MPEKGSFSFGFTESAAGLLVPYREKPSLSELDIIFGINCRQTIEEQAEGIGVNPGSLEFFDTPIAHVYISQKGDIIVSNALYYVEMMIGNDAIMVSYMPEGRETTEHHHGEPIREEYHRIAGSSSLKLRTGFAHLDENRGFVEIPPFRRHQLTTNSHPGLNLIVMRNAALIPRENWHEMG